MKKILTENGLSTHLDQQPILGLPFARPDCVSCPLVKAETPVVLQRALMRPLTLESAATQIIINNKPNNKLMGGAKCTEGLSTHFQQCKEWGWGPVGWALKKPV